MPDYDDSLKNLTGDEKILAECRDRFDYERDQWEDIREDARQDMKYVALDPWPEAEKLQRKGIRPCMVLDEYGQYANQVINDIRQNKRAVQVEPDGFGANDESANLVGDLFRNIEYESNAQTAYICGFENMLNRSYGAWIIRRKYVNDKSFDQKLVIDRIPNPDSLYMDSNCKMADYSDAKYAFLLDLVPRKEYKRRYPKATITDFSSAHMSAAPNWIKEDQIQVAEYWTVEEEQKTLYLVKIDDGSLVTMAEDELPEGFDVKAEKKEGGKIRAERDAVVPKVMQYITNGIEILETNPQPGKYIPIVFLSGKELYVDYGSGTRKVLMSLVRPMRDPLMLINYIATCKAEAIGMTPKTPWVGAKGQFHKPEVWQAANMTPVAFLEYDPQPEGAMAPMGPPQRQPYEPQIQQLEIAQESARRSVQAAGGMTALPTNAQRLSDKSGKALEAIDANEDRGTFHFIDNYKMAIAFTGTIMEDLRPSVYDAPREIGVRDKEGNHRVVKINQKFQDQATGVDKMHDMTSGQHKITIGSGPSFESERQAASEFADTVIPELEQIVQDPITRQKLAALVVKLKNVGPIGDAIVELLDPKDGQDQTQAQLQQATQQSQQYQQMVAELQTEVQRLELEKKARVIDNQFKADQAQLDRELKLEIAEVTAKSQNEQQRDELYADLVSKLHIAAHDAAMQAVEHAHKHSLADKAAKQASDSQAAEHTQQQVLAEQSSPSTNGAGA